MTVSRGQGRNTVFSTANTTFEDMAKASKDQILAGSLSQKQSLRLGQTFDKQPDSVKQISDFANIDIMKRLSGTIDAVGENRAKKNKVIELSHTTRNYMRLNYRNNDLSKTKDDPRIVLSHTVKTPLYEGRNRIHVRGTSIDFEESLTPKPKPAMRLPMTPKIASKRFIPIMKSQNGGSSSKGGDPRRHKKSKSKTIFVEMPIPHAP